LIIAGSTGACTELKGEGVALGVDSEWLYQDNETWIGDEAFTVLLYTDGLFDITNEANQAYGKDRLRQTFLQNHRSGPESAVQTITDDVLRFAGDTIRSDDMTLAVAKIDVTAADH
jgi:serine phosphatase RsbU (regulator of sigma subunit)